MTSPFVRVAALALLALTFAAHLLASPVITSVTPAAGTVDGGATVTIHGSGFSINCGICSPPFADPEVLFDTTDALDVEFVDSTTLRVITPPHIPGTVAVSVRQNDGPEPNSFTLPDAFTYTGTLDDAFDPILFPIFSGPVHGLNGSEFRTTATVWNRASNDPVDLYGVDTTCTLIDPPLFPTTPFRLDARGGLRHLIPDCSQTPGRVFYVPKGDTSLVASLRVWEVTRQSENHGVEIPVVRRKDFDDQSIALLGVPNDPKFRLTLRVYSLGDFAGFVIVKILNSGGHFINSFPLTLEHDDDPFTPNYVSFAAFPPATEIADDELIVLVEIPATAAPGPTSPIWAFMTVTNNETQHITTITPHQE
jgi:hypothetical protein